MSEILYLHGFASGPESSKGRFFYRNFAALGGRVHLPDLNEGDFTGLTISRQVALIERLAEEMKPSLIIGSSLGGYLAALHASKHPESPHGLVLLAPAFEFGKRWRQWLGEEEFANWQAQGKVAVYHYGAHGEAEIAFGLYEDSKQYEDFPNVSQQTLIFHGKRDDVVAPDLSVQYAWGKSNVQLELLDSDHRLLDVLDPIWLRVAGFYQNLEPLEGRGA